MNTPHPNTPQEHPDMSSTVTLSDVLSAALARMATNYHAEGASPSAYLLSKTANVGSPDSEDSYGADFLREVWDSVMGPIISGDASPESDRDADERPDDGTDVGYNFESRGTYRSWLTFTDLCLYEEDASDLGLETLPEPLSGLAWTINSAVARRLSDNLWSQLRDIVTELEDNTVTEELA